MVPAKLLFRNDESAFIPINTESWPIWNTMLQIFPKRHFLFLMLGIMVAWEWMWDELAATLTLAGWLTGLVTPSILYLHGACTFGSCALAKRGLPPRRRNPEFSSQKLWGIYCVKLNMSSLVNKENWETNMETEPKREQGTFPIITSKFLAESQLAFQS